LGLGCFLQSFAIALLSPRTSAAQIRGLLAYRLVEASTLAQGLSSVARDDTTSLANAAKKPP